MRQLKRTEVAQLAPSRPSKLGRHTTGIVKRDKRLQPVELFEIDRILHVGPTVVPSHTKSLCKNSIDTRVTVESPDSL